MTATVDDDRSWLARHAIDIRPLRHAAYRRLFIGNVLGGMSAWRSAGYPTEP